MSLLEVLQEELRGIHENQVDKPYIESEEFFDLIIQALEAAARTREREKISLYARILRVQLSATEKVIFRVRTPCGSSSI